MGFRKTCSDAIDDDGFPSHDETSEFGVVGVSGVSRASQISTLLDGPDPQTLPIARTQHGIRARWLCYRRIVVDRMAGAIDLVDRDRDGQTKAIVSGSTRGPADRLVPDSHRINPLRPRRTAQPSGIRRHPTA